MSIVKNSLGLSHDLVRQAVKAGDTVIDATAGNGNDTVFLAGLVGLEGKVYSFDIQAKALEKTHVKLQALDLAERVVLVHEGHECLASHVQKPVRAVMFNLGYLPGGDHSIGTRGDTTIQAVEAAMKLLVPGGIITIVIYYGGDSGFDEKNRVMEYVRTIPHKEFAVLQGEFINQVNCPPILICIEKLED